MLRTNNSAWREALTLKGQLNTVGFNVELEGVRNINQLIRSVFVKKDYDLAYWSLTVWNAAPWIALYSALHSESKRNVYGVYGYDNPEFDGLPGQLRSAPIREASTGTHAPPATLEQGPAVGHEQEQRPVHLLG